MVSGRFNGKEVNGPGRMVMELSSWVRWNGVEVLVMSQLTVIHNLVAMQPRQKQWAVSSVAGVVPYLSKRRRYGIVSVVMKRQWLKLGGGGRMAGESDCTVRRMAYGKMNGHGGMHRHLNA